MMKITINKQLLYQYLMVLLGFFIFVSYIWFRFIRERLPREIPFTLSLPLFIIIIIIIIILSLIFITYRLKYPKMPSQIILVLLTKISYIFKPLEVFNDFLNKLSKIQQNISFLFAFIIKKYNLYEDKKNYILYITFNIIPNILVLISFIFDVFFFNKIAYFYSILLFNLLPLSITYVIYSLKKQIEHYTLYLEKRFYIKINSTITTEETKSFMCDIHRLKNHPDDEVDPWNPAIPFKDVRFFIAMQANNLVFDYDLYEYTCVETDYAREEYVKKYNRNIPITNRNYVSNFDNVSIILRKEFEDIIPKVIYIKAFLNVYCDITKLEIQESWVNIFILLGYIICWTYILIVSLHTLNLVDLLDFLITFKNIENPF